MPRHSSPPTPRGSRCLTGEYMRSVVEMAQSLLHDVWLGATVVGERSTTQNAACRMRLFD